MENALLPIAQTTTTKTGPLATVVAPPLEGGSLGRRLLETMKEAARDYERGDVQRGVDALRTFAGTYFLSDPRFLHALREDADCRTLRAKFLAYSRCFDECLADVVPREYYLVGDDWRIVPHFPQFSRPAATARGCSPFGNKKWTDADGTDDFDVVAAKGEIHIFCHGGEKPFAGVYTQELGHTKPVYRKRRDLKPKEIEAIEMKRRQEEEKKQAQRLNSALSYFRRRRNRNSSISATTAASSSQKNHHTTTTTTTKKTASSLFPQHNPRILP